MDLSTIIANLLMGGGCGAFVLLFFAYLASKVSNRNRLNPWDRPKVFSESAETPQAATGRSIPTQAYRMWDTRVFPAPVPIIERREAFIQVPAGYTGLPAAPPSADRQNPASGDGFGRTGQLPPHVQYNQMPTIQTASTAHGDGYAVIDNQQPEILSYEAYLFNT